MVFIVGVVGGGIVGFAKVYGEQNFSSSVIAIGMLF